MENFYCKTRYFLGKMVVILMLAIFPIITHDGLYDINYTRFRIFMAVAVISFCIMIINEFLHLIKSKPNFSIRLIHRDYFLMLMFLILSTLSYVFSDYQSEALLGAGSRYTGYLFMVGLCLLYFVVRRCYTCNTIDFNLIFVSVAFINVLAVLNFCGIDPLEFFTEMKASNKDIFISTLGNIDIFAAYTCIFSPIAMLLFIKNESRKYTIFYGCISYLAMMGMIVSNSDSAFVGLILFFAVVPYFCFDKIDNIRRVAWLLMIIGLANLTLVWIVHMMSGMTRNFHSILGSMVNLKSTLILIIIAFFLNKYKDNIKDKFKEKIYRYVAGSMIAMFLFAFTYFTFINKTVDLGGFSDYLRFHDSWGSGRGYIWASSIEVYQKTPLLHRIFGTGEATYRILITSITSQDNSMYFGKILDSAHNEFIHYMITIGVFGVFNYIVILVLFVKELFSKNKKSIIKYAIGVGILCYVTQSAFNIVQPITTPILFVMLAIYHRLEE